MRPIFTIHAGEYLVGSHIEEELKHYNVWIPSKDSGVDLLVTNKQNTKTVSLQVKFSKDFLVTHVSELFQHKLKACGWWTLKRDKIAQSSADFWVLVLYPHNHKGVQFVFIRPEDLKKRLVALHGDVKSFQHYLWVTNKNKCWETRGLKKKDQVLIVEDTYAEKQRDFSEHLNNWDVIKEALS